MALYLGVDGGQSSTTALIADGDGRLLGRGVGGPCNHVGKAEGRARFQSAMEQCLNGAAAQAGIDRQALAFRGVCMGFSGGAEDKETYLRETVKAEQYLLTTDAWIALTGATGGAPGLITISGTGSIALGRNATGRTQRVGGWGYIFGDEGGGFDIVRQAIRAALRQEEGWGPETALRAKLLETCFAPDVNTLLHWFYTDAWPRARVASLARLVDEAAREGDACSMEILHNAAQQLATMAAVVRESLFSPGEPAAASYVGGVFRGEILRNRYRMLVELEEGNRFAPPVYGPAEGAVIEALRADGISVNLTSFSESLP